ncbi:NADH-quinone oxidoreductase subunit J [bacterium]|nr:NADH-quinone oxidoreductase subunit J [bacterium]
MAYTLFFLLSIVCIGSIIGMIATKNQVYNAYLLVLAFASMGGLFALLQAPFIAAVQIIIYAGAILVLFIFVIMMINLRQGLPPEKKKWTYYFSGGIAAVLAGELILSLKGTFSIEPSAPMENFGSPTRIGRLLFTEYLYPFEITSVLILAAIVGAIVLVKKREKK